MSKATCLIYLLLAAGTLSVLEAQVERASVVGSVLDKSGAAVSGAQIAVTNEATNTTQTVVTDSAGAYTVTNLIPGRYTVTSTQTGFRPFTYRGFELQVSQQA